METARFYLYWTAEAVEVKSLKTNLYIKLWSNQIPNIPQRLTFAAQAAIAANKKAKKKKTLWDGFYGRNPYCQIELELTRDEVYTLRDLSQSKATKQPA